MGKKVKCNDNKLPQAQVCDLIAPGQTEEPERAEVVGFASLFVMPGACLALCRALSPKLTAAAPCGLRAALHPFGSPEGSVSPAAGGVATLGIPVGHMLLQLLPVGGDATAAAAAFASPVAALTAPSAAALVPEGRNFQGPAGIFQGQASGSAAWAPAPLGSVLNVH